MGKLRKLKKISTLTPAAPGPLPHKLLQSVFLRHVFAMR